MKPTDAERDPAFDRLIVRGLEGETDVTGNACPDADLLAAWFDRSLSVSEAERIEAHASNCGPCQQILADLARSEPQVVRAAPEPAPARPWHWHWRWLAPVAAAAVVVVVTTRTLIAPEPGGLPSRVDFQDQARSQQPAGQQARTGTPPAGQVGGLPPAEKNAQPPPPSSSTMETGFVERPPASAPAAAAPTVSAAADRAQPAPVPAPLTSQVAPLQAEARADRKGFVGENRLAAQLPAGANAPGAAGGTGGTPAKPAAADKAEVVVAAGVPLSGVVMKARSAAPPIPAVAASPTGKVAWRVGAGGSIERSTDGRETWQPQASGVATSLAAVSAVADTACWAAGAHGVVLRTTDGFTWRRLASPTGSDLVFVLASSEAAAIVRAADGSEYATSDAGRTWQKR